MADTSDNIISIQCDPDSNRNLLQYSVLRITLRIRQRGALPRDSFRVVIRTNLNQAYRIRRQIIDQVERGQSYSTDFFDIPTRYDSGLDVYYVDVLLHEVGYFELKGRVESVSQKQPWVKWADGPNIGISVTPLEYGRNNSIYCAFIRQFGLDKHKATLRDPQWEEEIHQLEKQGACVVPPGGDFAKFMEELPFIIEELGMKIIHLLPINPVPTSYGRMGMYGSPYATTDYFGIDPAYGTFSRYKTIEDQFVDLTSTIHALGAKVFLDMVINHAGWASSILFTNRHWIKTGQDQQIISPGAWGVVWGDLVELDYRHKDLWEYMAQVFLTWCRRGIDGFRLDAGYMVPVEVWRYIIAKVRQEYPNTLFLLEGLGGPWETTERLLTVGQINWAYSELFQNYSREQIVHYMQYAQQVSAGKGVLVHYAETHDNDRLATKGKAYALMRLHLCAFTSFAGAWGFTNGVEWLATEKIDVHRNSGLNWGSEENLVGQISRINKILAENPAFWGQDNLVIIESGNDKVLGFVRSNPEGSNVILGFINLNTETAQKFNCDLTNNLNQELLGLDKAEITLHSLFDGEAENVHWESKHSGELAPGECVMYRLEKELHAVKPVVPAIFEVPYDQIALIYQILLSRFAPHEVGRINQERLLREVTDIRKFIVLVNTVNLEHLIGNNLTESLEKIEKDKIDQYSAVWTIRESNKEFIISGDKWLVAHTFVPCTAYLQTSERTIRVESIPSGDGLGHLSCFPPQPENQSALLKFNWKIRRNKKIIRQMQDEGYPILSVPSGRKTPITRKIYPVKLSKEQLKEDYSTVLLTNGLGGVCQCPALPGIVNSKYDALLSVAPEESRPAHRLALAKMLRETVQVGQKFFDLDASFLVQFIRYPQPKWEFVYDDGEYYIALERYIVMPPGEDSIFVRYKIRQANALVTLTTKCYIECRNIHDQVRVKDNDDISSKAAQFCRTMPGVAGVEFTPQKGIALQITAKKGEFIEQPHWMYDLDFPQDKQRGLEGKGDAFAPGLFHFKLYQSDSADLIISAKLTVPEKTEQLGPDTAHEGQVNNYFHTAQNAMHTKAKELLGRIPVHRARKDSLVKILTWALDQFLVRGAGGWLLRAGYPWLGSNVRDMLHCVGGLLAAGRAEVAQDVILRAAGTASKGLLVDWLEAGLQERTSTEASLRLFLAAQSYADQTGDEAFWDRGVKAGAQENGIQPLSLREVLVSIYEALCHRKDKTTDVVPRVDVNSGLLFSPAGYSWMNTGHPSATPRSGYPIEIQALWYQALQVLGDIYPPYAEEVQTLREQIAEKFIQMYWSDQRGYLADLLIGDQNTEAAKALVDSSLRFNQLAAIHAHLVPVEQARRIVDIVSQRLLIPGAVRSLSEDPLAVPLKIVDDRGVLLADPRMPYRGTCDGDETSRRVAYHNGTAWPSAYPSFIEARAGAFGFTSLAVRQALAFFEPIKTHLSKGGIGTLAQMKDGNYPHRPRGCYAYCLSVAEALRVYMLLKYHKTFHSHHEYETSRTEGAGHV